MKKWLWILGWCWVVAAYAQPAFEGEISYRVKFDEASLAGAADSEQLAAQFGQMMPRRLDYQFRSGAVRIRTDAALVNEVLVEENGTAYVLMPAQKMAFRLDADTKSGADEGDLNVIETKETSTILGYTCRRYRVEAHEKGRQTVQHIWATPDLPQPRAMTTGNRMVDQQQMFLRQIKGMPLRMRVESDGTEVELEAIKVEAKPLAASLFEIPADYQVEKFSASSLLRFLSK